MSLQLQHYNKSYAYTEKVVTFLPNHPSIILRSSFVHPSIGDMRMIIGLAMDGRLIIDNNRHICHSGGNAVLHEVRPYSGRRLMDGKI